MGEIPQSLDIRRGYLQVVVGCIIRNDDRAFTRTEAFFHRGGHVQLVICIKIAVPAEHIDRDIAVQCGRVSVLRVVLTSGLEQQHGKSLLPGQHAEFHLVLAQHAHGHLDVVPGFRHFQADLSQDVLPVEHHGESLRVRQRVSRAVKGEGNQGARSEPLRHLGKIIKLREIHNGVAQAVVHRRIVPGIHHRARDPRGIRDLNGHVRPLAGQRGAQQRVHIHQLDVHADPGLRRKMLVDQGFDHIGLVPSRADPQRDHPGVLRFLRHIADLVVIDSEGAV